jgi:hypothetical protein
LIPVVFWVKRFDDIIVCDPINISYILEDLLGIALHLNIDLNSLEFIIIDTDDTFFERHALISNRYIIERWRRFSLLIEHELEVVDNLHRFLSLFSLGRENLLLLKNLFNFS